MLEIVEEYVDKIDREIPNNEIIGRRTFIMINNKAPFILPIHEPKSWNNYTLSLGKCYISFNNYIPNNINYVYDRKLNDLTLHFNNDVTFLEARNLVIYILDEVKKWQKKSQQYKQLIKKMSQKI